MSRVKPDINRLVEFQELLLAFSQVDRVVDRQHLGNMIKETDTEHSYNLAMTAWLLSPHFPKLDRDMMIRMALVHDLVEVHAGDTFIYADEAHLATKHQREADALKKLKADWHDFPEMTSTIDDYEVRNSPEAKFIYALDKIMPIMLIVVGKGHTWRKEGITLKQLDEAKRTKVDVSPEIKPYYDELYDLLLQNEQYFIRQSATISDASRGHK